MTDLSPHQVGYIAGIIDGEGSIGLSKMVDRTHMKPWCCINNTDLEVLEIIQSWVGGNIHPRKIRQGYKQVYSLDFPSQSAILGLLTMVEPFLLIKKPQAQLMIAWCTLRKCGGSPLDEDNLIGKLKEFNKKGDS